MFRSSCRCRRYVRKAAKQLSLEDLRLLVAAKEKAAADAAAAAAADAAAAGAPAAEGLSSDILSCVGVVASHVCVLSG